MNEVDFYAECAALLGVKHEGTAFTHYKRTRWNNRTAGRGRFPGRGIIRLFGSTVHVALHEPALNGIFQNKDDALLAIKRCLTEKS